MQYRIPVGSGLREEMSQVKLRNGAGHLIRRIPWESSSCASIASGEPEARSSAIRFPTRTFLSEETTAHLQAPH